MTRLVEVAGGLIVVPSALGGGLTWYYIHKLRRPILLSPQSQFKPPLRWRWSLSQSAIFHRRMVLALRTCRATAQSSTLFRETPVEATLRRVLSANRKPESGWESILSDLEEVAIEIDRRLLQFEREPREVRRRMARGFDKDVAQVELASRKAIDMFQSWQRTLPSGSTEKIIERINLLNGALGEIREIDGLNDDINRDMSKE